MRVCYTNMPLYTSSFWGCFPLMSWYILFCSHVFPNVPSFSAISSTHLGSVPRTLELCPPSTSSAEPRLSPSARSRRRLRRLLRLRHQLGAAKWSAGTSAEALGIHQSGTVEAPGKDGCEGFMMFQDVPWCPGFSIIVKYKFDIT